MISGFVSAREKLGAPAEASVAINLKFVVIELCKAVLSQQKTNIVHFGH